jgi:hypothetical protein
MAIRLPSRVITGVRSDQYYYRQFFPDLFFSQPEYILLSHVLAFVCIH